MGETILLGGSVTIAQAICSGHIKCIHCSHNHLSYIIIALLYYSHHLLTLDLAVTLQGGVGVLPDAEAHRHFDHTHNRIGRVRQGRAGKRTYYLRVQDIYYYMCP